MLITIARLVVASVFLMAGLLKIAEGRRFVNSVKQFRLLPDQLATPYAKLLPWVELLVALPLFAGVAITIAASVALILCASFAVASIYAMKRRLNLGCSCFGLLYRERVGTTTVARDLLLMLLCGGILAWDHGRFALFRLVTDMNGVANAAMILVTVGAFGFSVAMVYKATRGFPPRLARRLEVGTQT
jgi:uncharacterized membrane protein YphA (DoxX/SURF4 family)